MALFNVLSPGKINRKHSHGGYEFHSYFETPVCANHFVYCRFLVNPFRNSMVKKLEILTSVYFAKHAMNMHEFIEPKMNHNLFPC